MKKDDRVKFTLRTPRILQDRIAKIAKDQKKSVNSWMLDCLSYHDAKISDPKKDHKK